MSSMTSAPVAERRMSAADRRDAILDAASVVFGERGYVGATTDQVARAAGISQPYVVRMFGSKEALFLAVIDRAKTAVLEAFRSALEGWREEGSPTGDPSCVLGPAYFELVRERGVHTSLMQAFMQGSDPVVGRAARSGFLDIWRFLREEAGLDAETSRLFLADGMLINVLLGLEMARDPAGQELLAQTFGDKLDVLPPA